MILSSMINCCKKEGVIISIKRTSVNYFFCDILFSDSVVIGVFVFDQKNRVLAVGHQVFGEFYSVNSKCFFKVQSLGGFIASAFWLSKDFLMTVSKLLDLVKSVPKGLVIEHLYDSFIFHLKMIGSFDSECVLEKFNSWLKIALT